MSLIMKIVITLAVVSLTTTLFVDRMLRVFDPDNKHGHQGGTIAVMRGSTFAALLYTPLLAFFVWDLSWWVALLVTPSAIFTGMLGFLVALPLLYLVAWLVPHGDPE